MGLISRVSSRTYSAMFDDSILSGLDWEKNEKYANFKLRPLTCSDFDEIYPVLAQLTKIGEPTIEKFKERWDWMKESGVYYVIVIEDRQTGKICGTGTLIVEQKFIHSCAIRGRIEDVVVCESYRGKGLGGLVVTACTDLSKKLGCYKTTLECSEKNKPFYQKIGYEPSFEKYMV